MLNVGVFWKITLKFCVEHVNIMSYVHQSIQSHLSKPNRVSIFLPSPEDGNIAFSVFRIPDYGQSLEIQEL
jgi:hypothetical protein